jgi:hypothetical protein
MMPEGLTPSPGDLVAVQISGAHEYDLIGAIVALK